MSSLDNLIKTVFLTPDEPLLRTGWRLLAQLILMLVIAFMVAVPLLALIYFLPNAENFGTVLLNAIPVITSVLLARRILDRRTVTSLGLRLERQALHDIIIGFVIAAAQIALIFGIGMAFGWLQFEGPAWQEMPVFQVGFMFGLWLLAFMIVGFHEELFSRGYYLQNLEEGLNTFWAVALSSILFGALHLANPGAGWLSAIGIALAGLFFAFAYLRTRQLWLAIGLHIGWNFFEGPVFGFPVSGLSTFKLLRFSISGSDLVTGGAFGPEAGLIVLPALGLGMLLVWLYTKARLKGK